MKTKSERWALVRLDAFEGTWWGRVIGAGSELAMEAARRLLVPDNATDFAIREEHLVPR